MPQRNLEGDKQCYPLIVVYGGGQWLRLPISAAKRQIESFVVTCRLSY